MRHLSGLFRSRSTVIALGIALVISGCSGNKIRFGVWEATTSPGTTDGQPMITADRALMIARQKLAELGHPDDAGAGLTFVPGLVRLDAIDGSVTLSSSNPVDAWIVQVGAGGGAAVVVVDADQGKVSMAGGLQQPASN
jgi:hypothetical protein